MAPLMHTEAEALIKETPQWNLSKDWKSIARDFTFKDFKEAMGFINEVADIAEFEGHHPDISISWNKVHVMFTTHAIKGLSENDFIMAAKINRVDM